MAFPPHDSSPYAPDSPSISSVQTIQLPRGSLSEQHRWLNDMAQRGWVVNTVEGKRYQFVASQPGEWRVHVEPCTPVMRQNLGFAPVCVVVLRSDPTERVVSLDQNYIIAVSPVSSPDPLTRITPAARSASYRLIARQGRVCAAIHGVIAGIAIGLITAVVWLLLNLLDFYDGFYIGILVLLMLLSVAFFARMAIWSNTALRSARLAAERLRQVRTSSTCPDDCQMVVQRRWIRARDCLAWLEAQAREGWTLVGFDGRAEYTFEHTPPGKYQIAMETLNKGLIVIDPRNVIQSITEPAPGEALIAQPDIQVVGASVSWVFARRLTELGSLTPPWPLTKLANYYTDASSLMRWAVSRTTNLAGACIVVAALGVITSFALSITVLWIIAVVLMLFAATFGRQLVQLSSQGKALKHWADRYNTAAQTLKYTT